MTGTARWTREDKRGTPVGRNVEEKEMFRDSSLPRVPPRSDAEIRQAAAWYAWDAIQNHAATYDEVGTVLEMLGLDRDAQDRHDREEPCWPYGGTSRGLNIHRKSYTYPCDPCRVVQDEQRRAPARQLGIQHEGTENFT